MARVLSALQWGRINPRDVHEGFRIPHDDYDLAGTMRVLVAGHDPIAILNDAEPHFLHYRLLKAELSLERWRWPPHSFPGRVFIINIPEFRLHAFNRLTADSTDVFSMDVVVGEAYDHRTPIFMEKLDHLSVSPCWEVPSSISRTEIRPTAIRAPPDLARNHYVLLGSGDRAFAATAANIAAIGTTVRVRQLPGASDAT